jgi:hypothetical protein
MINFLPMRAAAEITMDLNLTADCDLSDFCDCLFAHLYFLHALRAVIYFGDDTLAEFKACRRKANQSCTLWPLRGMKRKRLWRDVFSTSVN